jgi:two-component system, sensor histidine kinase and response regulator
MNKNNIIEPQEKNCILIVEDNADMRELLAQLLEEEDIYDLHFAENGSQVIEQATQLQPDLILMDMSLPGISGWEIVPNLRRLPIFSQTPIRFVRVGQTREPSQPSVRGADLRAD